MSLTAAAWLLAALCLAIMALARSVWGVAFYMLTFFAAPHLWWWGSNVPNLRFSLLASLTLAIGVVLNRSSEAAHRFTIVHGAAVAMAVNATVVHFLFATDRRLSFGNYIELIKFVLLFFLMWAAMRGKRDFRIVLLSIAIGAAYIGYEVSINDRGHFSGGRLEGVGAPGADTANSLASVLLVTIPLTGSLLADAKFWEKGLAAVSAPLALNVLLLCNSRGAFLGLIGAVLSFVGFARGVTRKRAVKVLFLGGVALFLLLGDPRIFERFTTTFAGSEERDESAASRLEFWKAGALMLTEYPLGAGGGAFKYVHGGRYLSRVAGIDEERSLHNGYLTEATSWGVQGLALQLLFLGGAMFAAYRTSKNCRLALDADGALIGVCILVATSALLIHSMFGSFLGNEWGYWLAALLVRYSELYEPGALITRMTPGTRVVMTAPAELT